MKTILFILAFFIFQSVHATSYARPQEEDVYSQNKEYVLHINPQTELHFVYKATDRTSALWSFEKSIWQEPYYISNDGKSVLTTSWTHVKVEHINETGAVYLFTKDGLKVRHELKNICSNPKRTRMGPVGSFWRTWYDNIEYLPEEIIKIETTGLYDYKFSLKDGSILEKDMQLTNFLTRPRLYIYTVLVIILFIGLLKYLRKRKKSLTSDCT